MKPFTKITVLLFSLIVIQISSQKVNQKPLNEIKVEYIEISKAVSFTNKIILSVDYGQEQKGSQKKTRLVNDEEDAITFNSMIEALNFMNANHYKLFITYNKIKDGKSQTFYILQKFK